MELVELGTLLEMEKGKKPAIVSVEPKEGFLPYVDIDVFEKGIIKQYTEGSKCTPCEDGDILIVCDGSRSGLVGKAVKGYVGSTLARISAPGLIRDYLYHFVQGKYALLNTRKKGTGTPHLNPELLKKQKLVVPDVAEQERIVARIEELFSQLDAGVETLKKTKAQLAVYRQAVLKEAFSCCAEKKSIREMSSIVTSGSRGWAKYYCDNGAKFIRIGNLTRNKIYIDLDDIQHVQLPDKAEGTRTKLAPNDVLVSITADLGSIGLVPNGIGEAYVNQHIAMIRFNNQMQGEFYAWYLRSEYGQQDLLRNKRGGGKLGLGLDDIRDSRVPVVSNETAESILSIIECRLSVCDSIEHTVDLALQQAEAMRQSILKDAFEGKL